MSNPTPLPPHKTAFLNTSHSASALQFSPTGYTLKSGRISPYFFNAGLFHRARHFSALTLAYAQTLHAHTLSTGSSQSSESAFEFDILFGPAYKGIPLAAAVVNKLAELDVERYGDVSYSFNRKEAKDHGEGGTIVGAPLQGKRVVIIDDVITAGTAIREAISMIKAQGGILVGIIVAFDRQEKMPAKEGEREEDARGSAIGEVRREHEVPVLAIVTLDDVVAEGGRLGREGDKRRLEEYREKYRASD